MKMFRHKHRYKTHKKDSRYIYEECSCGERRARNVPFGSYGDYKGEMMEDKEWIRGGDHEPVTMWNQGLWNREHNREVSEDYWVPWEVERP